MPTARPPKTVPPKFYTAEDASLPRSDLLALAKADPCFASWALLTDPTTKLYNNRRREFMQLAQKAGAWHGEVWEAQPSQAGTGADASPSLPGPPQLLPPALRVELAQFPAALAYLEAMQRQLEAQQREIASLKTQVAAQRQQPPASYLEAAKAAGQEAISGRVQQMERHVAAALEVARSRAEEPLRQAQLRTMKLRGSGATLASTPAELRQLAMDRLGPHMGGEQRAGEVLDCCGPLVAVRAPGVKPDAAAPADIHITAPDLVTHRPLLAAAISLRSAAPAAPQAGGGLRLQRLLTPLQQDYVARLVPLMQQARSAGLRHFILYVTMDLVVQHPDGTERRTAASGLPPPRLSGGRASGEGVTTSL